jgi:hypothetical protein
VAVEPAQDPIPMVHDGVGHLDCDGQSLWGKSVQSGQYLSQSAH